MPAVDSATVQGVGALRQAILAQAHGRAQELLQEAQLAANSILQEAEKEAEATRQEILDRARREASQEKQRRISAARLEVHRRVLACHEQEIDLVVDAAWREIEKVRHSDAYANVLKHLIAEAAATLGGGKLLVSAGKEEAALLDGDLLAEIARGLDGDTTLEMGKPLDGIRGGVVVARADGRMRYDNTFAGRLARARDDLRGQVYQILGPAA